QWYAAGNAVTKDMSIEALLNNRNLPQIFEANDKLNDLRADKIADEFNIKYIIKGGGNEFERIAEVAATNASYIIPVNFPDAYDVSDPYQADKVSLAEMRMWNQAPGNLKALADNNINFAITADGLKKPSDFKSNIMQAIAYGLDPVKALEALTTIPAALMGKSNRIGTLRNGAYANFLITSGPVFDKETTLYENWIQGEKHVVEAMNVIDIRGTYELTVSGEKYELKISGEPERLKSDMTADSVSIGSKITYEDDWVILFYTPLNEEKTEFVRLSAFVASEGNLSGTGKFINGADVSWTAVKKEGEAARKRNEEKEDTPKIHPVTYPNNGYGFAAMPRPQNVLFKNATVWTGEAEGILQNTDVLVRDGKIAQIGQNLNAGSMPVIDATGKHLTAGIIDEHSHIAASAINEAGHNSSAEVTIEDVVDSEDMNIYRNLAGGVTAI
ncbi:MAG: amidohydrolase family protein, partial [Sinomicrobium sp.]|nr:amidohydrolase family protein [Sinomicrobium sp.]